MTTLGLSQSSKTAKTEKKAREEPFWSAEAMNACWTSGWKRPEVMGAIEKKALEENKTHIDHLVDNEKTADAINDFFINAVTSPAQPNLAPKS